MTNERIIFTPEQIEQWQLFAQRLREMLGGLAVIRLQNCVEAQFIADENDPYLAHLLPGGLGRVYLDTETRGKNLADALMYAALSFERPEEAMADFGTEMQSIVEEDWKTWIGQKVKKVRKPFKSGQKINTVKAIIEHPILKVSAFTFFEDDSYVECGRCYLEYE